MDVVRSSQHDHGSIKRSAERRLTQTLPRSRKIRVDGLGPGEGAQHRIERTMQSFRQRQDRLDQIEELIPQSELGRTPIAPSVPTAACPATAARRSRCAKARFGSTGTFENRRQKDSVHLSTGPARLWLERPQP